MSLRKTLGLVSLTFTVFCLFLGFALAGQWIAFAATLIPGLAWIGAYKWPSARLAPAALVLSVSLAAIGLIAGASPLLMLAGATLALVSWNLVFLNHDPLGDSSDKAISLLEKKHYQSLGLSVGLSLLIFGGRLIRFQISFGGMILLVLVAFYCLVHTWRVLSK